MPGASSPNRRQPRQRDHDDHDRLDKARGDGAARSAAGTRSPARTRGSRGSSSACGARATARCWRTRGASTACAAARGDAARRCATRARAADPRSARRASGRRPRTSGACRARQVPRGWTMSPVAGRDDRAARAAARPRRLLRPGGPLSAALVAADDGDPGARRRRPRSHRRLPAAGSPSCCARRAKRASTRLFRIGGAHAIAALAYGTATIPRVDKIVGPGNAYVAAAKALVAGDCAIDFFAGPSEIAVVSTDGRPDWIAADLIAQAEHDPDARAILITPCAALARAVAARSRGRCRPHGPARPRWRATAAIVVTADAGRGDRAVRSGWRPSTSSATRDARRRRLTRAGTVFVGDYSAQACGDYVTGSNHVLPTSGAAAARGGLSAADFVRVSTVQRLTAAGCDGSRRPASRWPRPRGLPRTPHRCASADRDRAGQRRRGATRPIMSLRVRTRRSQPATGCGCTSTRTPPAARRGSIAALRELTREQASPSIPTTTRGVARRARAGSASAADQPAPDQRSRRRHPGAAMVALARRHGRRAVRSDRGRAGVRHVCRLRRRRRRPRSSRCRRRPISCFRSER